MLVAIIFRLQQFCQVITLSISVTSSASATFSKGFTTKIGYCSVGKTMWFCVTSYVIILQCIFCWVLIFETDGKWAESWKPEDHSASAAFLPTKLQGQAFLNTSEKCHMLEVPPVLSSVYWLQRPGTLNYPLPSVLLRLHTTKYFIPCILSMCLIFWKLTALTKFVIQSKWT